MMLDSYVYMWYDTLDKRYYIGSSIGKKKNYICSSKTMLNEYRKRPESFNRRILATGNHKDMQDLEYRLLKSRWKHLTKRYYNKAYQGPRVAWTEADSIRMKKQWADPNSKRRKGIAKMGRKIKALWKDPIYREKMVKIHKDYYHNNPDRNISEQFKNVWKDPNTRAKMLKSPQRTKGVKKGPASKEARLKQSIARKKWWALKSYKTLSTY